MVVGHCQQRRAVGFDVLKQQFQDLSLVARIQVARCLVGEHQPRPRREGPGHGHALLLADRELIGAVVQALLCQQPWMKKWSLVDIQSRPHAEVIKLLQGCALFLSFGHPEGFGLPVAEAMACGCAVIGYSGLGGRELFQLGHQYGTAVEVAFGDWLGFVTAAERLDQQLNADAQAFALKLLQM